MTMIFVLATSYALFLAGDSRSSFLAEDGRLQPMPEDTRQKVYLVGTDALIGQAGVGVIPKAAINGADWDALATLRHIAGRTGPGSFDTQFDFITQEYREAFDDALSRHSGEFPSGPPPKIETIFLKRTPEQRVYVGRQEFHIRSLHKAHGSWQHRVELDPRDIRLDGIIPAENQIQAYWSVPLECLVDTRAAPSIPRGQEVRWIMEFVRRVAVQSPQCSAQIGEPIRVATVDANGARWLAP